MLPIECECCEFFRVSRFVSEIRIKISLMGQLGVPLIDVFVTEVAGWGVGMVFVAMVVS